MFLKNPFTKTGFNIDKLEQFILNKINDFSKKHKDETFYAFAIDDGLLCFNTISAFEDTLKRYQSRNPDYLNEKRIVDLKYNTGDWLYRGFASLIGVNGFDKNLYDRFYKLGFDRADNQLLRNTEYYIAMQELINRLIKYDTFSKNFNLTEDFKAFVIIGND